MTADETVIHRALLSSLFAAHELFRDRDTGTCTSAVFRPKWPKMPPTNSIRGNSSMKRVGVEALLYFSGDFCNVEREAQPGAACVAQPAEASVCAVLSSSTSWAAKGM